MAVRRKRTNEQMIDIIVSRKTKGAAFSSATMSDYQMLLDSVRREVEADLYSLSRNEFFMKYENYLYDVVQ